MPKNDELSRLEQEYRRKKGSGEWEQHALHCKNPLADPPWRELAARVAQARAASGIGTVEECARQIFNDLHQLELDLHARRQSERYGAGQDPIGLQFSRAREVLDPPDDRLRKAFIRYALELRPEQQIDSELASHLGVPVTGAEAHPEEASAVSQPASHPEETEPAQETTQPVPEAGSRTVAHVLDAASEGPSPVVAGDNAPPAETAPTEGDPAAGASHDELVAKVKRSFGCDGKPPFKNFYEPLGITNSAFWAWMRGDHKHCGKSKWEVLNKAAALSQ